MDLDQRKKEADWALVSNAIMILFFLPAGACFIASACILLNQVYNWVETALWQPFSNYDLLKMVHLAPPYFSQQGLALIQDNILSYSCSVTLICIGVAFCIPGSYLFNRA